MPKFILSLNWTDQGIRSVKHFPSGRSGPRAAKKVALKSGVYLTSAPTIPLVDTPNGDNVASSRLRQLAECIRIARACLGRLSS